MAAKDYAQIAFSTMKAMAPGLESQYSTVIRFLIANPACASNLRGKNPVTFAKQPEDYVRLQARSFADGRKAKAPSTPDTIPDQMVSFILQHYWNKPVTELKSIETNHLLSMGAENIVGSLLELYLASVLEQHGWVWCSGSVVRAVDFIKPPSGTQTTWSLLQVKNRDNSENSSSSAIRIGTDIEKWHRCFAKRSTLNWGNFPDIAMRRHLSEEGFKAYVSAYLTGLK